MAFDHSNPEFPELDVFTANFRLVKYTFRRFFLKKFLTYNLDRNHRYDARSDEETVDMLLWVSLTSSRTRSPLITLAIRLCASVFFSLLTQRQWSLQNSIILHTFYRDL